MANLVGETLGNYRIEARLGAGGMGEVYRATHIRLDRAAAIKVLHANQAADPTFQARFLREARAAAALSHPNIVEVFDFGEQEGLSYLVMELIPDGSMRTLLKQRASGQGWSLGLGVNLVRQAAEGLAYAHSHSMVHRDVKPDNLLLHRLDRNAASELDDVAERYQLKISDFGLARLLEDGGDLTASGMVMGTPTYMSPEQCQGGALDGRSDLYSLGVVLYEVATGSPPFRVKSLSEAVFKHISAPPTPPRELRPDLPVALEEVILKCLAKSPDDRYATGTELAEALDGALGDTELRTIITTRDSASAGTPTPAAYPKIAPLVDPAAPTVAASNPGVRKVSAPSTPPTPVVSADAAEAEDNATMRASLSPAPAPRPAIAAKVKEAAKWPVLGAPAQKIDAGDGMVAKLLARPQALGIGIVAILAIVALLIVTLNAGTHGGKTTAGNGSPNATRVKATATKPASNATNTPVESLVFQDSLNSSSGKWENDSHAFYSNGGYQLNGAWFTFSPVSNLGDGTVSVNMKEVSGPSDQFAGILFRSANNSYFYVFGVSENQQWTFSLVSNGNGTAIVPATNDSHIVGGANVTNTLAVRAKGSHFIFYINGAQVGQADNSAISSGRVGIINTVGNLSVVYNNFTVTAA